MTADLPSGADGTDRPTLPATGISVCQLGTKTPKAPFCQEPGRQRAEKHTCTLVSLLMPSGHLFHSNRPQNWRQISYKYTPITLKLYQTHFISSLGQSLCDIPQKMANIKSAYKLPFFSNTSVFWVVFLSSCEQSETICYCVVLFISNVWLTCGFLCHVYSSF